MGSWMQCHENKDAAVDQTRRAQQSASNLLYPTKIRGSRIVEIDVLSTRTLPPSTKIPVGETE